MRIAGGSGACANGPCIVDGAFVFDLDGAIVADMNAAVPSGGTKYYLGAPRAGLGGYALDKATGFAVESGAPPVLRKSLPELAPIDQPLAGASFEQVGQGTYGTGPAMTGNASYGGGVKEIGGAIAIDAAGNVRERLLKLRDQQHASLLSLSGDPVSGLAPAQQERDAYFAYLQQSHIVRGSDAWQLEEDLLAAGSGAGGDPQQPPDGGGGGTSAASGGGEPASGAGGAEPSPSGGAATEDLAPPAAADGCGCRTAARAPLGTGALALLLLLVAAARRRFG